MLETGQWVEAGGPSEPASSEPRAPLPSTIDGWLDHQHGQEGRHASRQSALASSQQESVRRLQTLAEDFLRRRPQGATTWWVEGPPVRKRLLGDGPAARLTRIPDPLRVGRHTTDLWRSSAGRFVPVSLYTGAWIIFTWPLPDRPFGDGSKSAYATLWLTPAGELFALRTPDPRDSWTPGRWIEAGPAAEASSDARYSGSQAKVLAARPFFGPVRAAELHPEDLDVLFAERHHAAMLQPPFSISNDVARELAGFLRG